MITNSGNVGGRQARRARNGYLARSSSRAHPNLVVVEGRAAVRRGCIGASQHIDALSALMGGVGPDALGDNHTGLDPIE